eukprot:3341096-Amphidinium_carterae.1
MALAMLQSTTSQDHPDNNCPRSFEHLEPRNQETISNVKLLQGLSSNKSSKEGVAKGGLEAADMQLCQRVPKRERNVAKGERTHDFGNFAPLHERGSKRPKTNDNNIGWSES